MHHASRSQATSESTWHQKCQRTLKRVGFLDQIAVLSRAETIRFVRYEKGRVS